MDEETLFTTSGQDSKSGDIIIKTVNLSDHAIRARIDVGIEQAEVCISTLRNTRSLPETKADSVCGGPEIYQGAVNLLEPYTFPASSLTVIRIFGK